MDLAKIRKKNRPAPKPDTVANFWQENRVTTPDMPAFKPEFVAPVSQELELFKSLVPEKVPQPLSPHTFPERSAAPYRNPLEVILAGRDSAGCEEKLQDDEESIVPVRANHIEYLCFRVSDEIYGVNIMDIKEITRPLKVTEVPRAPEFVAGIISLRGTIIPIIDMRSRLGLPRKVITGKERIVVIKLDQSFSGLFVDEVIQVVRINSEEVEPAPSVLDGIDREFVSGIGRFDGRLIILLNLESVTDIHLIEKYGHS